VFASQRYAFGDKRLWRIFRTTCGLPARVVNCDDIRPMTRKTRLYLWLATLSLSFLAVGCESEPGEQGPVNIDQQVLDELNEPYIPFEPELGAALPDVENTPLVSADLPYPPFNPHDLKNIGPEGWPDREPVFDANVGGVKFNLIWSKWQPAPDLDPDTPNAFEHEGKVWLVSKTREKQIRWFSERGIKVTAVLYGTPEWARPKNTARVGNVPLVDEKFIAPDDPADFASFAGMLARRFNGANGNGRIVNFVIQNEVNALDWFNPGCGIPKFPCKVEDRIEAYADIYNQSYDEIVAEQSEARVLLSFDHHFGLEYKDKQRFSSAQHFIEELDTMVGDRKWQIAFHSYPPDLFNPNFGPYDYPKVTFGNLGVLAGYLRQTYPDKPYTWEIHLTENGINSGSPSSKTLMEQQLRKATRNVIGTPGIETFYYHRLKDHYQEGTFTPGLFDASGTSKPAWHTWSSNNQFDQNPPRLDDGYELLPYVGLTRSRHPSKAHWASSRAAPDGYIREATYLVLREPAANTSLLYECHVKKIKGTYISRNVNCEGHQNFGPVGYIYNDAANGRSPLYRVKVKNGANYLLSTKADEANGEGTLLGYVDNGRVVPRTLPARDPSLLANNQPGSAQNGGSNNTNQQSTEVRSDVWGDCSTDDARCSFLHFSHSTGQTHTLTCETEHLPDTAFSLSYGNTQTTSVENLIFEDIGSKRRKSIPVVIPDDANWASITSTTESQQLAACYVLSEGGLALSAAFDQNRYGLLYNGGFEASITDWEFCTTESITEQSYEGARAARIEDGNCVFQEVDIEPGQELNMTCHALALDGETSLALTIGNSGYQTLLTRTEAVSGESFGQYSATLIAPATSSHAVVSMVTDGAAILDSCSLKIAE
jgi:hypothetical protein